jgi:hypothetical protein
MFQLLRHGSSELKYGGMGGNNERNWGGSSFSGLKTYGPDLLEKCRVATELSKSLVSGWLER